MSFLEIFLITIIVSQNVGLLVGYAVDRQVRRDVAHAIRRQLTD